MGLAGARKMEGSATREPELIYVVRGASCDNNSWKQTESSSNRPAAATSERLLPSAYLEPSGDAAGLVVFFLFKFCNQKKLVYFRSIISLSVYTKILGGVHSKYAAVSEPW